MKQQPIPDHEPTTKPVPRLRRDPLQDEPQKFSPSDSYRIPTLVHHHIELPTHANQRRNRPEGSGRIRGVVEHTPAHDEVELLRPERRPKQAGLDDLDITEFSSDVPCYFDCRIAEVDRDHFGPPSRAAYWIPRKRRSETRQADACSESGW